MRSSIEFKNKSQITQEPILDSKIFSKDWFYVHVPSKNRVAPEKVGVAPSKNRAAPEEVGIAPSKNWVAPEEVGIAPSSG